MALAADSPNPFVSGRPAGASAGAGQGAGSGAAALAALAPFLKELTDRMVALVRAIEAGRGGGALLLLAAISFVYGLFHALGPGHGKTMIGGFFIARDSRPRHAVVVGFLMALFHALSALTVVMTLWFVVRGIFSRDFEDASRIIRIVSFGIVAAMGLVMLLRAILGKEHSHSHPHDEGETGAGREAAEPTLGEMAGLAFASGIVPCPGASAIILLSLSLGLPFVSLIAVSAISLGMGLTVSGIGVGVILARQGMVRAADSGKGHAERSGMLRRILTIAGAFALFALGLLFFLAQF